MDQAIKITKNKIIYLFIVIQNEAVLEFYNFLRIAKSMKSNDSVMNALL